MFAIGIPDVECGTCWYDFEKRYFHPDINISPIITSERILLDLVQNQFETMVKSLIETGGEDVEEIRNSIQIHHLSGVVIECDELIDFRSDYCGLARSLLIPKEE